MAKTPAPADAGQRIRVVFNDGREEVYDAANASVMYQAARLGVNLDVEDAPTNDQIVTAATLAWLAAGRPGLNGDALTRESADAAIAAWMDDVAKFENPDEEEPRRPPPRAKRPK
jgi:hypothetical protein